MRRRIHVEPSSDFPTIEFDPYETFIDDIDKFGELHVVDDDALCDEYIRALEQLSAAQTALLAAAKPSSLSQDEISALTLARIEWTQYKRALDPESDDDDTVNVQITIECEPGYEDQVELIKQELDGQKFDSADELLKFLRKLSKNG